MQLVILFSRGERYKMFRYVNLMFEGHILRLGSALYILLSGAGQLHSHIFNWKQIQVVPHSKDRSNLFVLVSICLKLVQWCRTNCFLIWQLVEFQTALQMTAIHRCTRGTHKQFENPVITLTVFTWF